MQSLINPPPHYSHCAQSFMNERLFYDIILLTWFPAVG